MHEHSDAATRRVTARHFLSRIGGWCLALAGVTALAGGACPCCGQPSCPVGAVGAGLLGGALTLGAHIWKRLTKP